MLDALDPILSLSDETPYFPENYYETRRGRFVARGTAMVLAVVVAYLSALQGGFLWTDDVRVANNLHLRTLEGLIRIWGSSQWLSSQGPIAETALWVQFRLWGAQPLGYHVISLLLHAANCLLAWAVLRRLAVQGAWLAAAVFGLHPVQVQSVAWISQQANILSAFFALAAALALLRLFGVEPPPPEEPGGPPAASADLGAGATGIEGAPDVPDEAPWAAPVERPRLLYGTCLLLFVCAVLTRPAVASLLAVIVLLLWWKQGQVRRKPLLVLLPLLAVMAAVALAANRGRWPDGAPGEAAPSGLERCVIAGRALWFYVGKLVCPCPLLFVYPRWQTRAAGGWHGLFPAGAAAVGVTLWALRARIGRGPLVAMLSSVLILLPALGFVPNDWTPYSFVADHFLYLGTLGPIAMGVAGLLAVLKRVAGGDGLRLARLGFGAAVVAGLAGLTWQQGTAYADEVALWEDQLAKEPDSAVAHRRLGTVLTQRGEMGRASREFAAVLRENPNDVQALVGLGKIFEARSDLSGAIQQYRAALWLTPRDADLYAAVAGAEARKGDLEQAAKDYSLALSIRPDEASFHNDLGLILAQQGRLDSAVEQYRAALRADPQLVPARINLANVLFRQGMLEESAEQLQRVTQIDPNSFEAYMNAGAMLGTMKDFAKAQQMFQIAVRLKPDSAEAWNNLGIARAAQGRLSEAIYSFGKAVDLKPGFEAARQNLERARAQAGQKPAGATDSHRAISRPAPPPGLK